MMTSAYQNNVEPYSSPDHQLRDLVGYNLKRAYNEIQAELAAALRVLDLKVGAYAALNVIVNTPGLKQSALADTLAIEQANLVSLLDMLEARELIKRERAQSDRRAYALFATHNGQQLCAEATQIACSLETGFLGGISADDITVVIKVLQQIEQNIRNREASGT